MDPELTNFTCLAPGCEEKRLIHEPLCRTHLEAIDDQVVKSKLKSLRSRSGSALAASIAYDFYHPLAGEIIWTKWRPR